MPAPLQCPKNRNYEQCALGKHVLYTAVKLNGKWILQGKNIYLCCYVLWSTSDNMARVLHVIILFTTKFIELSIHPPHCYKTMTLISTYTAQTNQGIEKYGSSVILGNLEHQVPSSENQPYQEHFSQNLMCIMQTLGSNTNMRTTLTIVWGKANFKDLILGI